MAHVLVHLVHGTQFYLWRKPRIPWVEDTAQPMAAPELDSFCRGLRQELVQRGHSVTFDVVPWSGRNRHGAREAAAGALRENVLKPAHEPVRRFVVAHSHGGNACLLALKDDGGAVAKRLSGIVCLSTPFLVVRKEKWALNATIAWMTLVFMGATWSIMAQFERAIVSIPVAALTMSVLMLPLLAGIGRYRDFSRWAQAPEHPTVPILIVRCIDDEASSGLGFVAVLARVLYQLEHLLAWPLRMLQRHPVRLWLGAGLLSLGIAFTAALSESAGAFLAANWKWLLAVLVGPWFLGLPARLIVYGLAYGLDLFGLPLQGRISAETTPLGRWESHLVAPGTSEERRAAHSEPYMLRSVQRLIADWIGERLAAAG